MATTRGLGPDPRTSRGMVTAMVERHPEYNWHADARKTAARHRAEIDDGIAAVFMDAFRSGTTAHPLSPKVFRVWRSVVVFEVWPLRRSGWNADVNLSFVQSLTHGRGDGSRALEWLLRLADEHGAIVRGDVQQCGRDGLRPRELRAWYRRHGFSVSRSGEIRYEPKEADRAAT